MVKTWPAKKRNFWSSSLIVDGSRSRSAAASYCALLEELAEGGSVDVAVNVGDMCQVISDT